MHEITQDFSLSRAPEDVQKALQPFVGKFGASVGWATYIQINDQEVQLVHPLNGGYHVINGSRNLDDAINHYYEPTRTRLIEAQVQANKVGLEMTLASGSDVSMIMYSLKEKGGYYEEIGTQQVLGEDDLKIVLVPKGHPLTKKYNNTIDLTTADAPANHR
jgi:hypothetical protein